MGICFIFPQTLERSPFPRAHEFSQEKEMKSSLTFTRMWLPESKQLCLVHSRYSLSLNEGAHHDQASPPQSAKPFRGAQLANPYSSQNKVYIYIIITLGESILFWSYSHNKSVRAVTWSDNITLTFISQESVRQRHACPPDDYTCHASLW